MRIWSELISRWRSLFDWRRADGETAEEIGFHLEMETEKLRRSGHSPTEAARLARVSFGRIAATQEDVREARGTSWFDDLGRDLRHSIRQLRRSPGFAFVAIVTLALGVGANTAIFSLVDGVLLRPIPFRASDRLVVVWENDRTSRTTREPSSWPDYLDFARQVTALSGMAALAGTDVNLTPDNAEPARLSAMRVTSGYFELVGMRPLLGRTFTSEEAAVGGTRVVLLGEATWRSRFNADPNIVGRQLRFNDEPTTVIGVLPRGADFGVDQIHARANNYGAYSSEGEIGAWFPIQADESQSPRYTHSFLLIGRLTDRATVAAASQEIGGIATDLERAYPQSNAGRGASVESLEDVVLGPVRPVLGLLVGAVALVLLVACVNVANLLLVRGTVRAREVAVRGALGAGFGRLGRQFMTESVLLSVLGAVAGMALAYGGLATLVALAPGDVPRIDEVRIDLRVLAITLLISILVGITFGWVPTLQARGLDVVRVIRSEICGATAWSRRLRNALVVAEMALSVMLVVGAGLLVRSFRSVLDIDPGFHAGGVLKAEYQLPPSRYPRDFSRHPNWVEIQNFHAGLLERVARLPGVESAAIAAAHPLDPGFTNSFVVVGREAEASDWGEISVRAVSAGYFTTLRVPVRSGRLLENGDTPSAPAVAVINEAAVARYFPNQDPLGQQIRFWGVSRRIVGVVGDERIRGLTEAAPAAIYLALPQSPSYTGVLLVRTAGDPEIFAGSVRAAVWTGDPQLAVFGVEPLADTLSDSIGERRFAMIVLGGFAVVALLLALVGVYGVISYTTAQRTRELGVRAALGASGGSVVGLVLRGGMRLAAVGIAIGLLGAASLGRLFSSLLFQTGSLDPLTYLVVPAAVIVAALIAAWLPARRAAKVAPIEALRGD